MALFSHEHAVRTSSDATRRNMGSEPPYFFTDIYQIRVDWKRLSDWLRPTQTVKVCEPCASRVGTLRGRASSWKTTLEVRSPSPDSALLDLCESKKTEGAARSRVELSGPGLRALELLGHKRKESCCWKLALALSLLVVKRGKLQGRGSTGPRLCSARGSCRRAGWPPGTSEPG